MFIQTEETPNPNALKFLPNQDINPDNQVHFSNQDETRGKSLLAFKLFNVDNIKAVFLGGDFITITKEDSIDWSVLKPKILMTIMDHLVSGMPAIDEHSNQDLQISTEGLSDVEKQIIEIIETRVRPSVAMDGGDIVYKGFENSIVRLELRGSCSGCPSSTITLKNGIESMLKHFVPEVESVEAVEEDS